MEKLLPCSLDAENGVLGSIIIDPDAYVQIADILRADDFYRATHQTIYEVICRLNARGGAADFITICEELERRGKLGEVDGASYITGLINDVPTSGNISLYARIVADKALQRRLIYAASQIAAAAYDAERASDALDKAEELIYQISRHSQAVEAQVLAQLSSGYLSKLEALHSQPGAIVGIPTGYRALDRITGGWQRSDLIVLAARPGLGKTSLALCLADYAAKFGTGVGFYSLEMGKEQLYTRLLSMETGIDSAYLRSGRIADEEWQLIVDARDRLDDLPLWIDDTGGLSTSELRSRARRLCTEHSIGLLIVDYLQLLQAKNESGKRYESEVQEVTEISRALKGLAKELNVPIIALSQLSRTLETRQNKRPMLSDLRSSGSIEQDADLVMFLYRDSLYNEHPTDRKGNPVSDDFTELNIEKHRNGPIGDIGLSFDASHTRFA